MQTLKLPEKNEINQIFVTSTFISLVYKNKGIVPKGGFDR